MRLTTKQLSEMKINGNNINLVEATTLIKFAAILGEAKVVGAVDKVEGKRGRVSKIWEISDTFLATMKMIEPRSAKNAEKGLEKAENVGEKPAKLSAKKPTKKSAVKDVGVVG